MPQGPPQIILDLIERFERNAQAYRSPAYNETQVRQEFINPFFEALGWDVANKERHAEAYKDVIHEDAIKVGAPDYCFRIGNIDQHVLPYLYKKYDVTHRFDIYIVCVFKAYELLSAKVDSDLFYQTSFSPLITGGVSGHF